MMTIHEFLYWARPPSKAGGPGSREQIRLEGQRAGRLGHPESIPRLGGLRSTSLIRAPEVLFDRWCSGAICLPKRLNASQHDAFDASHESGTNLQVEGEASCGPASAGTIEDRKHHTIPRHQDRRKDRYLIR